VQAAGGNVYENSEPETNITLQENTNTGDSCKVPLHSIANIKSFKLACININSLYKHIDEIRYILMFSSLEVLPLRKSTLFYPYFTFYFIPIKNYFIFNPIILLSHIQIQY
jgi:hypothetical protein